MEDRIKDLKVRAYDLLAQKEQIERELMMISQELQRLYSQDTKEEPESKQDEEKN